MLNVLNLIVLFAVIILIVYLLIKGRPGSKHEALSLMQQQIDGLRQQMGDSLNANTQTLNQQLSELNARLGQNLTALQNQMLDSQKSVGERLDTASVVVTDVQKNLAALAEATQRVFDVGKDISSLQEILRAPKLRGGLGELFLGDLLQQILPAANIELQHKFKNGDTVDAVIRLGSGLVSVDSKFPLENFRKMINGTTEDEKKQARRRFITDIKKHIDAIANKYILPDEGTFDFALMYIPAENVYYELIIKDEENQDQLNSYALAKKVIPVSPNSFYAYLQAIVLGLKGLRVQENVQEIIKQLERLGQDMRKFHDDFDVLGRHVVNLKNKYDEADKKINNFESKLLGICRIEDKDSLLSPEEKG